MANRIEDTMNLEKALCDALGLKPEIVKAITIRIRANEPPRADIEMYVQGDGGEFTGAIKAITWGPVQEPVLEDGTTIDYSVRIHQQEYGQDHDRGERETCQHPDCVTISDSTLQFLRELRGETDVEISVEDGSELSSEDQDRLRGAVEEHTRARGVRPRVIHVTPIGAVIESASGQLFDNDTVPFGP